MKLVFMGTPEFAVPSLELLSKKHEILAVITVPDKPAGRGKSLKSSAVKIGAQELNIPVLQPTNLKDAAFQQELKDLSAELFVVLAFRMLPEAVWSMPPMGTINLHASLLPQYRGAAPINRAIINGETKTGLTTFFIERDIDTGKIIDQKEMTISENETAGELHDRMMSEGAILLLKTVDAIESGDTQPKSQKSSGVLKEAHKIFKEDCEINWNQSAESVHNHIRGLSPYPAAWTPANGVDYDLRQFKILKSRIATFPIAGSPGCILLTDELRLFVKCDPGNIEILELQAPGKKRMKTTDFLRGFNPPIDFRFFE